MLITKKIKIINPQGLHARPASNLVKLVSKFESDVMVRKGGEAVNGKSIMSLMTLAANHGAVLEVEVSGPDAEEAMKAIEAFLTKDTEEDDIK